MDSIKFTPVKLIFLFLILVIPSKLVYSLSPADAQSEIIQAQASLPLTIPASQDSQVVAKNKEVEASLKPGDSTLSPKTSRKPINIGNSLFLKAFGKENVAQLRKDLIAYGNTHLPTSIRDFYIGIVNKIYTYPIILFFILLILVFFLNIVFVLLVLNYSNKKKNRDNRYIRIYGTLYEEVLRAYLFEEITWETALIQLKRNKKAQNRKILISVLMNFQENLRGGMDSSITEIYTRLGLNHDSLKSVKSAFYHNKVRGISELTNLYPVGAPEIIQNYINHPNDLVRAEAQASYIRLHPDQPFDFLKRLTLTFTRWTQLTAFYLFRLHSLPVPSFNEYLKSEHPSIRIFCLRMIIYFQQLENAPAIFKLLDSESEQTRYLSIRAINDLRLYDGRELIKGRYDRETDRNRMEIVKAFKSIGTSEDIPFLENVFYTGSVTGKTEACRSLYFMNEEGRDRLNFLKQNADLKIEQYIAHVSDPRN